MTDPHLRDGSVPLTHWGVIRARGIDAASFLQGQLTNDVLGMAPDEVRLAGFCSAKGRLQATFIVWKAAPDDILLACPASVLPATLKRMSMFVLRSKCRLSDASDVVRLHGRLGPGGADWLGGLPVWRSRGGAADAVLRLPDVGSVARCIVVGPAEPLESGDAPGIPLDVWRQLEVESGLPVIEAATVDQFVPQMLNYEVVGGVDFGKGCYPGQEVVARSQYRGTIKRRMFLFDGDAPAVPGAEVFHSADPSQPAGMVVNAAANGNGGCCALVEVKLTALDSGTLHIGDPNGAALHRRPLPYTLPSDAVSNR